MSRRLPGVPLITQKDEEVVMTYDYYLQLRVNDAWRIPILYGRLPTKPDDLSSTEDRGAYALFMMLLFRHWRGVDRIDFISSTLSSSPSNASRDDRWKNLYATYLRWRKNEVDDIAAPFFNRGVGAPLTTPAFDTAQWWACVIF